MRRRWLRPLWHAIRPEAILISISLVLVLGTVGYQDVLAKSPQGGDYSVLDAFYRALGLFTLGGGVDPPLPLELQIARIIAPVLTGYAVVQALLALFRDNLQILHLGLWMRNHTVVAGLGVSGSRLVKALDDEDERLVAIELDAGNPALQECRDRGISVLRGNAADPAVLARAQVRRARRIVVVCGDDSVDMEVVTSILGLGRPKGRGPLSVFVGLDQLELWRYLSARMLGSASVPGLRIQFFHANDLAARLLFERHPPLADGDSHVVFVGLGGVGESALLQLARLWRVTRAAQDDRIRVTVAGLRAEHAVHQLVTRYPALESVVDLHACESAPGATPTAEAVTRGVVGGARPTAIYVCVEDEADALATGLALGSRQELNGVAIVVTVAVEAGVVTALMRENVEHPDVVAFDVASAVTPELVFGGPHELLAREKHNQYVRAEVAKGARPEQNGSLQPWESLSEDLREANRDFADGVGAALREADCMLVPAPLAEADGATASFADDLVEGLARAEHERWVRSRTRAGWRYGPERDDQRLLHPSMVPWEDLPDAERNKDREPMRELPEMLAHAGFQVVPRLSSRRSPD